MYEKCELAQELVEIHGFECELMDDWLCLIEHESAYNTQAYNDANSDGSIDFGLYMINDYYWCYNPDNDDKDGTLYNDCNVDCEDLIDNSITDDSDCAQIVYDRHGFEAWYGWLDHCQNGASDGYADGCGLPC